MAETETLRVYVFTEVWQTTTETEEEAQEAVRGLLGRFREEDVWPEEWRWEEGSLGRWIVKVRRWVPKGEYTDPDLAEAAAEAIEDALQPTIVARNSADEHRLLRYGTVPLKEAASGR